MSVPAQAEQELVAAPLGTNTAADAATPPDLLARILSKTRAAK